MDFLKCLWLYYLCIVELYQAQIKYNNSAYFTSMNITYSWNGSVFSSQSLCIFICCTPNLKCFHLNSWTKLLQNQILKMKTRGMARIHKIWVTEKKHDTCFHFSRKINDDILDQVKNNFVNVRIARRNCKRQTSMLTFDKRIKPWTFSNWWFPKCLHFPLVISVTWKKCQKHIQGNHKQWNNETTHVSER